MTQMTIPTFFVLSLADVVPIIIALNLNDSEFAMYYLEYLSDIAVDYTSASQYSALSSWVLFIWLM